MKRGKTRTALAGVAVLAGLLCGARCEISAPPPPAAVGLLVGPLTVPVEKTFSDLVADEDTDNDKKITVDDRRIGDTGRGDKVFVLEGVTGERAELRGAYALSILLQELTLAREAGQPTLTITPALVSEDPVARISRLIRERYWDGLTRRVDPAHIERITQDSKQATIDGFNYIYVPFKDALALDTFNRAAGLHPEWRLKVVRLPEKIGPGYARGLDGRHGILTLGLVQDGATVTGAPFVVPGGRFNEMYGWDSYFESLGLIVDGRLDLAAAMVDNFVYEIENYGKILNANRSYYLTRSQPPFLTSMALAVYEAGPKNPERREWLKTAFVAAIAEYRQVWTGPERLTDTGLSRYYDSGSGPCPEVEPGHYFPIVKPYADALGITPQQYLDGFVSGKYRDENLDRFFKHDRAVRESGHDTTYRFDDRTSDFVSVDLNSLLYKIETDIARTIDREFGGRLALPDGKVETSGAWRKRAEQRKLAMNRLMWDPLRGMFFDYDFVNRRRSTYVSATTFYPLWAGLASREQAARLVKDALPRLEEPGGVAATSEDSRGPITAARPQRQWDYPNGWAPHQMLIWQGLLDYGYKKDAQRLAYKWLWMITRNAVDFNGTIPEKYDVVKQSHQVFAEYGNVGTDFDYITREGFGWMNASYQVGLKLLTPTMRKELGRLTPAEELFRQ